MTAIYVFVSFFILVYGAMHAYFYVKLKSVARLRRPWSVAVALALVLMVVAPLMQWRLEAVGPQSVVRPIAFLVYAWMGFLFLFCCLYLLIDLYTALLALVRRVGQRNALNRLIPPQQWTFAVAVLLTAAAWGHGYATAQEVRVERVRITTDKLPGGMPAYRIVQLTDLHLGPMTDNAWLQRLIDEVQTLRPNLIVATGDIIDSHVDGSEGFIERLSALQARDGKYAVTGNHEFFAGIDRALEFHRSSGFTVLRGKRVAVSDWLQLAGMDDRNGEFIGQSIDLDEADLLPVDKEAFTILLKHQPVVRKESIGRFDLQLSGHVHHGQIYPFIYLTRLVYPVRSGLSELGEGSWLYVSRGAGTWGPPIRFLAPPEITLFEIVAVDSDGTSPPR